MFKKVIYGIVLILIAVLAWYTLGLTGSGPEAYSGPGLTEGAAGGDNSQYPEINLSYQADQDYEPEIAILNLGVETADQDLDVALNANNQKMDKVVGVLKSDNKLEYSTLTFQVNPQYREENGKRVIYYQVLNQLEIRTEQINDIGRIIQESFTAGANQVISLSYTLKDMTAARQEVTRQALNGLGDKADFVAGQLGKQARLVTMNINDSFSGVENYSLKRMPTGLAQPGLTTPPITPRKIKVRVNINSTYSLE